MKLLRRNTTVFGYRAYTGETEVLSDGMHTGNYQPAYSDAVEYRGNISSPSGHIADQLFGIDTKYTHILLMDKPNVDIREEGLVEWKGDTYEIRAVRPSLNVLAVALKKRTGNAAPPVDDTTNSTGTGTDGDNA